MFLLLELRFQTKDTALNEIERFIKQYHDRQSLVVALKTLKTMKARCCHNTLRQNIEKIIEDIKFKLEN